MLKERAQVLSAKKTKKNENGLMNIEKLLRFLPALSLAQISLKSHVFWCSKGQEWKTQIEQFQNPF